VFCSMSRLRSRNVSSREVTVCILAHHPQKHIRISHIQIPRTETLVSRLVDDEVNVQDGFGE
jgi:hypothetical protein